MTNQKLEQDFGGIGSIPTAFVVDRKGNLVLRHSGFGDREFWERAISSLFVQPGSGVQLRIERNQEGIVLSWPDAVPGFVLEESASLSVPTWRTLSSSVDRQRGFWTVTLPVNQSRQFFRLIQQ